MLDWTAQTASFCRVVIDAKIASGELFLPKRKGFVLFYAGPGDDVVRHIRIKRKDPSFTPIPNWQHAAAEATRLGADRIDDTPLFKYLMSPDFETDLRDAVDVSFFELAVKAVWDYVSSKFSQTGDFVTASALVCGADEWSSFRAAEMMGMLKNPKLKIFNNRSVALFQDFCALGEKEVFRLACLTKLIELRARARASNDNNDKAFYKDQRANFLAWRVDEKAAFKALPKPKRLAFRRERRGILQRACGARV